jgi:hypothetical protein
MGGGVIVIVVVVIIIFIFFGVGSREIDDGHVYFFPNFDDGLIVVIGAH